MKTCLYGSLLSSRLRSRGDRGGHPSALDGSHSRPSEPGSYRLASVAGERVLVVRDHDGSLGAFANRCMHRGTELVDSSSPIASACFESAIRCPNHFWAYGFDGSPRATPWVDDIGPAEFSLHRFAIDEWGGFAFVRLSSDGASLADDLDPIAARVCRFPLDQLVVGGTVDYDVAANWKVLAENYNECYHCGPVHPELCELVPSSRDHVAAFILQPVAAGRTMIACQLLFHPDEVAKIDFDPSDAIDFWHMINLKDWAICERVQRGMTSRTFGHGWYAPMEDASLDIRRWWTSKMNP